MWIFSNTGGKNHECPEWSLFPPSLSLVSWPRASRSIGTRPITMSLLAFCWKNMLPILITFPQSTPWSSMSLADLLPTLSLVLRALRIEPIIDMSKPWLLFWSPVIRLLIPEMIWPTPSAEDLRSNTSPTWWFYIWFFEDSFCSYNFVPKLVQN